MNSMCLSLITILFQLFMQISSKKYFSKRNGNVKSLCEDPEVYAADRLVNNTVRLYRDNHYWELKGIPGTKGFLDGPHKIWYKDFGAVHRNTSLVTFLSGYRKGFLTKFEGRKWWAWQPNGYQGWGDHGHQTDAIPNGGFMAVFHNGNETDPMLIGFESIKVYYYTTKTDIHDRMRFVGSSDGYIGGQFNENFPPDITAAFSYPSTDPNDGYFVYLFKKHKYCFRAAYRTDAKKQCEEWRFNTELFGCNDGEQFEKTQKPEKTSAVVKSNTNSGGKATHKPIPIREYDYDTEAALDVNNSIAFKLSFTCICVSIIITIWSHVSNT